MVQGCILKSVEIAMEMVSTSGGGNPDLEVQQDIGGPFQ